MCLELVTNIQYSFSFIHKNVYEKYLRTTYLKKQGVIWYVGLFMFVAVVLVIFLWVIPNREYLMSDEYIYMPYSSGKMRRMFLSRAVPLCIALSPAAVLFALFFAIPLLPKGFELGNHAWPRMYRWRCRKETRQKFLDLRDTFFNHFERHPMQVDIKRDRIIVYDEDGNQREVTFDAITQAYRGHSLLVLHVGSLSVPDDEIIIDYSQLPRKERLDFLRFIDSRLLAECKCYYFRKAKPRTTVND